MDEFFDYFFSGEDIYEADVFDFYEEFSEEVGGPCHFVDEAVGEAEDGGFEGGGAAGDDAAGGGLHEVVAAAGAEFDEVGGVRVVDHVAEGAGEFWGSGGDFEGEVGAPCSETDGGIDHHGEEFGDFAFAGAGEEADEVGDALGRV